MEAKELRIGNYVEINAPIIDKNIRIDIYHISELKHNKNFFKPIPITEEILLKCGFYKTTENAGNLICFKKGKYTIAKWINNKWQFWINTISLYNLPQYLHQLQNLYFALTGKELEINL